MSDRAEVPRLVSRASLGDEAASARLMEIVYDELRALAGSYARGQRVGHTLQPTALVHEAFVKLIEGAPSGWNDREHFFAIAATAMRQVLTDHARARQTQKRGGGLAKVTLDEGLVAGTSNDIDLVALDEALAELVEYDARKARVVDLRFFGGLTAEETARVLKVSVSTVESDWRAARAWLQARLGP